MTDNVILKNNIFKNWYDQSKMFILNSKRQVMQIPKIPKKYLIIS